MFNVDDRVTVPSRGYSGVVSEVRDNEDGSRDYLVTYEVPKSLKGTYHTWWPESYLEAETEQ